MKLRVALPILAFAAAVMLTGLSLSLVEAQDRPSRTASPAARLRRAAAAGEATAGESSDSAAPGAGLRPFETGIDYRPTSPRTLVTFNLEDADLPDLVRLISQITGRRFILPSKARSLKATVYAPTKVTAAEAYQAFLSILEINGMSLVPAGRYLKIVESAGIETRPISLYNSDENVPPNDRFVTRLHRVDHVSAEDVASLVERFKSGDGSVTAYAPTNTLILTDTGTNLQRMLRIIGTIDTPRSVEQIWIEPVHYANAGEIASRLEEIFQPAGGSSSGGAGPAPSKARARKAATTKSTGSATIGSASEARITKILADERTNSLIILATERSYLRILEMLRHLDVPMEGEGRIHVHYMQHSDSKEVAATLQKIIGEGGGSRTAKKGGGAGGDATSVFEGQIRITAHETSNALVITSSSHDYAAVRHVIDRLDVERRQVFIEAVIMELGVERSSELGVSFHAGIPGLPSDGSLSVLGFNAQNTISGVANADFLTGLAVGVQGPIIAESQQLIGLSLPGFGVALSALASESDTNILSTPHLIAMDNVEAEINVGQNVPLQTSGLGAMGGLGGLGALGGAAGGMNPAAAMGAMGGLGGLGGFGGAVPRQDVGTTIKLTPHINDSDEIRLEISEEISSAGAPSSSGNLGVVSIARTRANTQVVVRDQQTVVIGGLMRDDVSTSETKVPILGDIPLIGALFRSTTKRKSKRNLILFLTPYIVRSPADLRAIYERKMRERQEFLDRYFVFANQEYEPPIDYARTRGLVGEILAHIRILREDRELRAEAAAQPVGDHRPRPPIGAAPPRGEDEGNEGDLFVEPEDAEQAAPAPDEPPPPPELADEPAPPPETQVVE